MQIRIRIQTIFDPAAFSERDPFFTLLDEAAVPGAVARGAAGDRDRRLGHARRGQLPLHLHPGAAHLWYVP